MRNFLLVFAFILLGFSSLLAQVYEGTAEFDKKKMPAFIAEYSYPAAAVENAIVKRFSKLGYRPREEKGLLNRDKGFNVFAGSIMPDIAEGQADFLIKVDSRSRKGNENAVLTLVVTQGGEALGRNVSASRAEKVKDFLRGLTPDVVAESLELDIKAQEEAIVKAEKKLESLKKDQADLERKIELNKQSQRDTENEIGAKKEGLDVLKSRRVIPAVPTAGQL
ncbi:MAG: hypothetical protein ACKOA3_04280 [Sphingomonadales bacterium]